MENQDNKLDAPTPEPQSENKTLDVARGVLVFVLLIGVIVASFWISYYLGKRILSPGKETAHKVEIVIPEPPPSIAALQAMQKKEAVAKKKAPAVKQTISVATAGHYYKVQAGNFNSRSAAKRLESKIKASGFETLVKKAGKGWRVQVGAFKTKAQAQTAQGALKTKGFTSVIIYE